MFDVVIVGAGPAGLNAALVLGRCRRSVLLCDPGRPRNAVSRRVNGFLTRDGESPTTLLLLGREQLRRYDSVESLELSVVAAHHLDDRFAVTLSDGTNVRTRKLLVATGMVDQLPDLPGFRELWGNGAYSCPYCNGWEHRDKPLAVYGQRPAAGDVALELTAWSKDIVLFTDGGGNLSPEDCDRLAKHGIRVIEDQVESLIGNDRGLEAVRVTTGQVIPRRAIFVMNGEHQRSDLAARLGYNPTTKDTVDTHDYEKTNVPGMYVAGDASRTVQFAVVAAAEGAMAAFAINTDLLREDLH